MKEKDNKELTKNSKNVTTTISISNPEKVREAYEKFNSEKFKHWAKVDSMPEGTQSAELKEFKKFISTHNKNKYGDWTLKKKTNQNDGITEENVAFDTYIAELQDKGTIKRQIFITPYDGEPQTLNGFKLLAYGFQNFKITQNEVNKIKPLMKAESSQYIFLSIKEGKISDRPKLSMTIYGEYRDIQGLNLQMNAMGYVTGEDGYSKEEIDKIIQEGGGGSPQPPPQPQPQPQPQPVEDLKCVIIKAHETQSYDQLVKKAYSGSTITTENDEIKKKLNPGDYVIITYKEGKVSDKPKMTFNIYGKLKKVGSYNQVEIDGKGYSVGIKTLTEEEIIDKIEHAVPPVKPPTPGTTPGGIIKLPELDREDGGDTTTEAYGDYGLNLIDYRKVSKDSHIGVAGQYAKVKAKEKVVQELTNGKYLYTKYKRTNGSSGVSSINSYGGSIGVPGIKKGIEITFNDTWKEIPNSSNKNGELIFRLIREELTGELHSPEFKETYEEHKFNLGAESKTLTPSQHGRYQIELGASNGNKADSYMVEFRARYGGIEPKGLKRDFEFKKYKGHTLKANHYIKDEYRTHKLGNAIIQKVGIAKFKDLDWVHSIEVPGAEPHYIYAKVPFDCKVPTNSDSQELEKERQALGKKLMSNNLTEVLPPTDEHIEKLPVDKYPPYLEQYIVELPWGDKQKPEWCFILLTTPENAKRWGNLLAETTITYELKEEYQKPIYLQEGGFQIVLTTGEVINSYDLQSIKHIKTENSYLLTDINNNTKKISQLQIVSLTPNIEGGIQ